MWVPSQPNSAGPSGSSAGAHRAQPTRRIRVVTYLHHTRDADGDVIFFFTDPKATGTPEVLQSSPIRGLRRVPTAVIDRSGHGGLARYRIVTQHTEYEVQMPADKAHHLATELGLNLAELAAEAERAASPACDADLKP